MTSRERPVGLGRDTTSLTLSRFSPRNGEPIPLVRQHLPSSSTLERRAEKSKARRKNARRRGALWLINTRRLVRGRTVTHVHGVGHLSLSLSLFLCPSISSPNHPQLPLFFSPSLERRLSIFVRLPPFFFLHPPASVSFIFLRLFQPLTPRPFRPCHPTRLLRPHVSLCLSSDGHWNASLFSCFSFAHFEASIFEDHLRVVLRSSLAGSIVEFSCRLFLVFYRCHRRHPSGLFVQLSKM